jgi:N utilization substance protein A
MLVALGKEGVKSLEDFAGCAADDLVGWTERKDGEAKRVPGWLEGFDVNRAAAEQMIMAARIALGWVTQEDLDKAAAEKEQAEAEAQAQPQQA